MKWGSGELRGERRVVEAAGDAGSKALDWEALDSHRNANRELDGHGEGLLSVRTAAEAVVSVLRGRSAVVVLDGRFGTAQRRHEQIRRRPRQQETGHDANDDVPADSAHGYQYTCLGLNQQVGRCSAVLEPES